MDWLPKNYENMLVMVVVVVVAVAVVVVECCF